MPEMTTLAKYKEWAYDAAGVFVLASFLALGFYLRFIVDLVPECYFTDALIVYIECNPKNPVASAYFQFFSPLVLWILPFIPFMAFNSLWGPFIILGVVLFSVSAFRVLRKIFVLFKKGESRKKKNHALMLLAFILTPFLIINVFKSFTIPPDSSTKVISIDLWNSQLRAPRNTLEEWSLIEIKKPIKPYKDPHASLSMWRKDIPFAKIRIPDNLAARMGLEGPATISVTPRYESMSKDELFQQREKLLSKRLKQEIHFVNNKKFQSFPESPDNEGDWLVYKNQNITGKYEEDIYIMRDENGQLLYTVECMASHTYQLTQMGKTRTVFCSTDQNCRELPRRCQEKNAGEQSVAYGFGFFFDKQILNDYPVIREDMMRYISAFITPKTERK